MFIYKFTKGCQGSQSDLLYCRGITCFTCFSLSCPNRRKHRGDKPPGAPARTPNVWDDSDDWDDSVDSDGRFGGGTSPLPYCPNPCLKGYPNRRAILRRLTVEQLGKPQAKAFNITLNLSLANGDNLLYKIRFTTEHFKAITTY